ncbi:hypothetical protein BDZ97DRAFT_1922162 [Flammula alnicola]|nr:hypothetical protein BDZ97DRAFT_1922162 [Flammula alnicola]
MDGRLEPLEKIFQKVEQESEQRAQEAQLTSHARAGSDGVSIEKPASAINLKRLRERRRGSISISRIGQLKVPEEDFATKSLQAPLTPSAIAIASNSHFYQSQIANGSTNSIASGASAFSNDHAHTEDDSHVTQMHHIVGKQSIPSKMLPRRLSRSHSASVIPSRGTQNGEPIVVIGVSVEEATVESVLEDDEGGGVTPSRRASVVAHGTLRSKSSRSTLPGSKVPANSWLSIAKSFTQKFSRKA